MAKVRLNPAFNSLHGRIGKIVHYRRYGDQCARSHVIPRNPDTPAQRENRKTFAVAVRAWQGLPPEEKHRYNRKAGKLKMSGYNLFISMHMKENIRGRNSSQDTMLRSSEKLHPYLLRSASVLPPDKEVCRLYMPYIHGLPPVSG